MIELDKIPIKMLHNLSGGNGDIEAHIYADELNRIIKSRYAPGVSTGYHLHEDSSEIIFILEGTCIVRHDGKEERLGVGDCHYCKKGQSHSVVNDGETDLVMYAIVINQ